MSTFIEGVCFIYMQIAKIIMVSQEETVRIFDNIPLTEENKELAAEIFRSIDLDGDSIVNMQEAVKWWNEGYAKIGAMSLFDHVDKDRTPKINFEEWMWFWRRVKSNGYSNQEIAEELEIIKAKY